MSRAEIRRQKREQEKVKTATYNLTKAQLDQMVKDAIGEQMEEIKQQATDDAINTAVVLLLTLPLEVLMDHYWPKTYAKKIPEFTNYVLQYYEDWEDGKIDIDDLINDLWEYAGVRLEEGERE
ncbi:MAG: hypothetical protein LIP12_00055 [Clostridiales bacterium]|nr:hypothetical protein [Clostridiales bacterium]